MGELSMMRYGELSLFAAYCICAGSVYAAGSGNPDPPTVDWTFGGHAKYRFTHTAFPDNSIFQDSLGENATGHSTEVRLKLEGSRGRWDFNADYQFIAIYSDILGFSREFPVLPGSRANVINDDRRWFDLTHDIEDSGKKAVVQRLDRLSLGYSADSEVVRFGRQAISWGNGMVFTPMDVFNPFDPAAVDKEYKTGDDMLYGQYLFGNGNDLQGVGIVRRNPLNGQTESDQSSLAVKYHGFAGFNEYDLLAASHYGDNILGIGGILSVGGSIWRGDLTWTDTAKESVVSAVASISYSWVLGGRNWSGVLEYYHNGFGQPGGDYSGQDLAQNLELLKRLERGELFTLGRDYVVASATVEMTPLFLLIPNVFVNLGDPSGLLQVIGQYDWKQDLQVLAAVNIPLGPDGSEYGGIDGPQPGTFLSTDIGMFAQLAWYF
jgi:hypothetical protein